MKKAFWVICVMIGIVIVVLMAGDKQCVGLDAPNGTMLLKLSPGEDYAAYYRIGRLASEPPDLVVFEVAGCRSVTLVRMASNVNFTWISDTSLAYESVLEGRLYVSIFDLMTRQTASSPMPEGYRLSEGRAGELSLINLSEGKTYNFDVGAQSFIP